MTPKERYEYIAQHWASQTIDELLSVLDMTRGNLIAYATKLRKQGHNLPRKHHEGHQNNTESVWTLKGVTRVMVKVNGKWKVKDRLKSTRKAKVHQPGDTRTRKYGKYIRVQTFNGTKWETLDKKPFTRQKVYPVGFEKLRIVDGKERMCVRSANQTWVVKEKMAGAGRNTGKPKHDPIKSIKKQRKQPKPSKPSQKRAPKPEVKRLETLCRAGEVRVPIEVPRLKLHIQCRPENVERRVQEYTKQGYEVKVLEPVTLAA